MDGRLDFFDILGGAIGLMPMESGNGATKSSYNFSSEQWRNNRYKIVRD